MKYIYPILILFFLSGCISREQQTLREQIYADAQTQKSYNEMKAREADAQAVVDKEYARQDGMTQRISIISNTLPFTLMLLIFGSLLGFGVWSYFNHKLEFSKLQVKSSRVIYMPTVRDVLDYANTVDAELTVDQQGYILMYPEGKTERLLPIRRIR